MNEHSSRSHTILTVHIHSEEKASSDDNKVLIMQFKRCQFFFIGLTFYSNSVK